MATSYFSTSKRNCQIESRKTKYFLALDIWIFPRCGFALLAHHISPKLVSVYLFRFRLVAVFIRRLLRPESFKWSQANHCKWKSSRVPTNFSGSMQSTDQNLNWRSYLFEKLNVSWDLVDDERAVHIKMHHHSSLFDFCFERIFFEIDISRTVWRWEYHGVRIGYFEHIYGHFFGRSCWTFLLAVAFMAMKIIT
jgi:hypothetical protein